MHIEWIIRRPQIHCNFEMHFGIPLPIDVSKCQLTEIGTFYIFEAHIENGLETSCLLLRFKTSKALVLQTLSNLHQKSAVMCSAQTRTLERFPLCRVVSIVLLLRRATSGRAALHWSTPRTKKAIWQAIYGIYGFGVERASRDRGRRRRRGASKNANVETWDDQRLSKMDKDGKKWTNGRVQVGSFPTVSFAKIASCGSLTCTDLEETGW